MAKVKGKPKKETTRQPNPRPSFKLSERTQDYIFIGIIIIILLILLKPLVIDGLSPQGVDVIPSRAQSYQNGLYYKTMNQHALWNPYIFGGMPTYHSIRAQAFSVDNLLYSLGKYSSNVFTFYILGAIGLFILLRYLKMNPVISFIVVIIFVLLPHYKSLYLEGHFAKFSALMNVPWIILTFLYFQNKRNILSTALFALAFGLQIRTQHYQIVFYTGLLLFAIGVYPFLKDLFEKKYSIFIKSTILLFVALALSILMSAQPLFLAKEYLPYSKRGKTTIDLNNRDSEQNKVNTSDGVTFNYATQWSTAPSELLTWFIPRYYGGMSNEIYKGDAFNGQLKNREIPGYWGQMPFTQSYEYLGVLTLLLAVIGIYAYRKDKFIISLLIFAVFLILLSFGRHFESFYKLFYYYFPFFNKFRAPMMSVTITSLIICILAGYGLRYLLHLKPGLPLINYKNLFIILGSFFAFSIIIWLASLNNSFIKPGENYDQQTITILNTVRKEFVAQDILRYFILITISSAVIMGYLLKKMPSSILFVGLIIISFIDLANINSRYHKKYSDIDKLQQQYFRETQTDHFINSDKDIFRIMPVGNLFSDNRWAAYHQTIGGYSPIKMYTIEELIQNNLYKGWDKKMPINWNVLQTLNVKYLIFQNENIVHKKLKLVYSDKANNLYTYQYLDYLPRGYFVENYKIIQDEFARLAALNDSLFNPEKTAILEEDLETSVSISDSNYSKILSFDPNGSSYEVYTDHTALFVISELFYPPGWEIAIDAKQVQKIYKTNHAVQSIIVPAGKHKIDVLFKPESYFRSLRLASTSLSTIYIIIIVSLLLTHKEKIRKLIAKK